MGFKAGHFLPRSNVTQLDRTINSPRGQRLAIRRNRQTHGAPSERLQLLLAPRVPKFDRSVIPSSRK